MSPTDEPEAPTVVEDSPALRACRDAADRGMALLAQARRARGEGDAAAARRARNDGLTILMQGLQAWLETFFRRYGLEPAEAEDLTQSTFLRLLQVETDVRRNALAVVCRARRSELIDFFKHRGAGKRTTPTAGGRRLAAEITMDSEAWVELAENTAAEATPLDLVDCVRRQWQRLADTSPARAELLEMQALGLSARQIAAAVLGKAEETVTRLEEGAMRDRLYQARRLAQALLAVCRD